MRERSVIIAQSQVISEELDGLSGELVLIFVEEKL